MNRKIPNSFLKILLVIFLLMPSLWLINDYRQNYLDTKRNIENKNNTLAASSMMTAVDCTDGTHVNQCSGVGNHGTLGNPWFCNQNGWLVLNSSRCGCEKGYYPRTDGTCSVYPHIKLFNYDLSADISPEEEVWRLNHSDASFFFESFEEKISKMPVNPHVLTLGYVEPFALNPTYVKMWEDYAKEKSIDPESMFWHYYVDYYAETGHDSGWTYGYNASNPGVPPSSAKQINESRMVNWWTIANKNANFLSPAWFNFTYEKRIAFDAAWTGHPMMDFSKARQPGFRKAFIIDNAHEYTPYMMGINKTIEYWNIPTDANHPLTQALFDKMVELKTTIQNNFRMDYRIIFNMNDPFWYFYPWYKNTPSKIYDDVMFETTMNFRYSDQNLMPLYQRDFVDRSMTFIKESEAGKRFYFKYLIETYPPDDRGMTFLLSSFYLFSNPNTYFMFADYYPGHPITRSSHYKDFAWIPAVEYDIGQPIVNSYGLKDVYGTPNTNHPFEWANGTDPQSGSTFHIIGREFDNALVLVKWRPSTSAGIRDNTITNHPLSGNYYILHANATLTGPVGSISLRNNEALILIKESKIQKPTCKEGKATAICQCAGETLSAGQWCCSSQKKTICSANADCSSGFTCSNPNTCQAQCVQIQKPSADIIPPAITKISPAIISLADLKKDATAKITITGKNFASGATVKVNDVKATKVTFKRTTSLEAIIPLTLLKPGQASITITNKDGGSIILANALTLTNAPSPIITISSPIDKAKIAANTVELAGKVNDPDAMVVIKVGTKDQGFVMVDSSTGVFKKKVNLRVGKNTITMTAKNVMGTATKTLTISNTYSAPVITISSPADKVKIAANTVEITGKVSDPTATVIIKVGTADQGSVEVNSSTGAFKKVVNLAVGKNTIIITSLNVMGTTTKTLTISNTLPIKTIIPSSKDSDNDQLTDVEEALFTTDPKNPDTDGDSHLDGVEVKNRYSPKAGSNAKLKGTNLVKTYNNSVYNYSVLYPSSWSAQATTTKKKEIVFTAKTGEFVKILVEDNPKGLSARAWFLTEFPGTDTSKIVETTIGGLKGINNGLNDTIYLADGTRIYVLSYNFGTKTEANFRTTFAMISGSFTFNESTKSKPTITKVTPKAISLVNLKKNATTKITITGKNFLSGAAVKVNNIKATAVTIKSATSIQATIPLTSLKPGLATVTVTNTDKGTVTLVKAIALKGRKPTLSSADPKTLPAKKTGVGFLTLKGKNFLVGAKVLLDGKTAVTKTEILSASRIKITLDLSLIKQGKNYNLMIVNPDGQKATLGKAFKGK